MMTIRERRWSDCARMLALLCGVGALAAGCSNDRSGNLQGYAEGEFVYVASPYAGILETLDVARGQQVAAGARLFVLEHGAEQAAVDAAAARIRSAQAQLANLGEGRRAAELDVIRAQADSAAAALALSRTQLGQAQKLYKDGFVSQARLDEAKATYDRDAARVAEARASMAVGLQALGRKPELDALRATIEAAEAERAQARVRLDQKTGLAPAAALVYDTYFRVGESVPAGSPVASLLPPANIKIRFYAPETLVGALAPGRKVTVSCDGCPAPIAAEISYVSPQAEYTPPVIYSRESRAKLVFLVEARPAAADAPRLRPGQPVDVTLARP
jgi:HlyD family secretion protein